MVLTTEERVRLGEAMNKIEQYIMDNIVPKLREDIRVDINDRIGLKVTEGGSIHIVGSESAITFQRATTAPVALLILTNWQDIKMRLNTKVSEFESIHNAIMNFVV